MSDVTNPDCKALICCGGEDFFENYSSAGPDEDLFFNEEVSYTSECPPFYNCTPTTVTIPANANRPARNKTPYHPASPAEPPGPAPCLGPFTGATQAEANAKALACAEDSANAQTVITGPIIYYNTLQTVTCPPGYAGGPFTVAANAVSSLISQAAANAQALAMAQALATAGCLFSTCNGCLTPDGPVLTGDGAAAASAGPVSGAALEDYIFVANATAETVSVIDFSTKLSVVDVIIGSVPQNLTYVSSNNKVYVVAVGGIYTIDPTTFALSGPIALPGGLTAGDLGGRAVSIDTVNDRVYIIADATGGDGSKHIILSIDTLTDTASILVTLPPDGINDFTLFGERVAHSTSNDRIYVFYLFVDLVDGANNEMRVKVYDSAGVEQPEIVIADGDAFSSDYVPMYYFAEKDRVYAVGEMGDAAVGSFKAINPATDTVIANISSSVFNTGSLDLNVAQDLLVYHKAGFPSNSLVCIQASSNTVTCTRLIDSDNVQPAGAGLPASMDGVTFVPRSKYDDCLMFICDGTAGFVNTEQTVNCPSGFIGGPFTVPVGVYSGATQAEADALALADAQAQADANCVACVNNPVSALVWTLTGTCGGSTASGGAATLTVGASASCTATTTLIGSCNEYTLSVEVTSYNVGTTTFFDGPSGASSVRVKVDTNEEFAVVVSPPGGGSGCTASAGGPNTVTHLIPAGVGTHDLELSVTNGSIAFPPGPCTCTATFALTPLTPP